MGPARMRSRVTNRAHHSAHVSPRWRLMAHPAGPESGHFEHLLERESRDPPLLYWGDHQRL
jgi:hypothetical protein